MAVQTAVDVLARVLDAYESGDRSVRHVSATTSGGDGNSLQAELEVPVPLGPDGRVAADDGPVEAAVADDGVLSVAFPTDRIASVPSPPGAEVTSTPTSARVSDGEVLLSVAVTITPTDGGSHRGTGTRTDGRAGTDDGARAGESGGDAPSVDREELTAEAAAPPYGADGDDSRDAPEPIGGRGDGGAADGIEAARNEDVPPYEDTPYLREIYRQFDTFSEMRGAIEMDVSTETVRRYMIDAGIHDPSSYETAAGAASGGGTGGEAAGDSATPAETTDPAVHVPEEQLVTDGIGLPDDLSMDEVLDAVVEAHTVYEVTRTLGLDQHRTRALLEQLDLLDLVMHRVSDDRREEVTYEDVADRLRRAAGAT